MMNNNNGYRPLGMRKTVQLMVILTILAWATQTLLSQWGYGATPAQEISQQEPQEPKESFVPAAGGANTATATLEMRGEATVIGDAVKLKQVCRWNAKDNAFFAPVADLVITRLDINAPYRTLSVPQLKELLHDAGVNLSNINFSGAVTCTVDRSDVLIDETQALEKWRTAKEAPGKVPAPDAPVMQQPGQQLPPQLAAPAADAAPQVLVASEGPFHTLRDVLTEDLAARLSMDPKALQITFNPRDEKALSLAEPQFRFQVVPQRAKNLGPVSWEVHVTTDAGIQRIDISGMAKAWQEQVVLARPISARQLIREEDVVDKRVLVDKLDDQPLLKREQVVGNQSARDLKPGAVFTAKMVEPVPLARAGQFVTITLTTANVKVKTVARAMESGSYGQTIRVKNEATKEIYEVILTGPQTAEMNGGAMQESRDAKVASASE
ncbi:MAG TPA: flagellar basal body P-ring formation chaperone FlgA [Tepidisphaeraceae bacterium]|nr:flagellar basal body P-ring formation chaperone FlgA [Tepidisphaeraceae bacterium]